jgi:hypothetical protein
MFSLTLLAATPRQQPVDAEAIAGQQAHWASTFDATDGELPAGSPASRCVSRSDRSPEVRY